jgi:hypothetical protein
MSAVASLAALRELDLSETLVGNAGLEELRTLGQLEKLNLWAAPVDDAGMAHVAAMTSLKWLNLDNVSLTVEGVKLTDEGVAQLTTLQNLEWLHLGKTDVGDEGLKALEKLNNLQQVTITNCPRITDAGVERLQEALPKLDIVR